MMKKLIGIMLIVMMSIVMVSCGSNKDNNSDVKDSSTEKTQADSQSEADNDNSLKKGDNHILVVYFSWSGNTEQVADMIADETGGKLFEIVPEVPYTDDYDAVVDKAQEEQNEDARPAIAGTVDNWTDYDTVFIGYPNWWSDTPMIIKTFLESYDFNGKKVIPFCTHGGGGFGNSLNSVKTAAKGASFLDGFEVKGSDAPQSKSDIDTWLHSLNLQ